MNKLCSGHLDTTGAHTQEHLRTASVWLSRLLSGSADPPQNSVWLIYCLGWCSAPHSAQPRRSELSLTTAKPTDTAFSLHKPTALQLFSTLFPTQNYSVNISRDNSPNPDYPCILSNSFAIPHLPPSL